MGTLIYAMLRTTISRPVANFSCARPFNSTRGRIMTLLPSLHISSPQSPRFSTSRSPALAPPDHLDPKELHIFNRLVTELSPSRLEVRDVSGGCGLMYAIEVASQSFKGLPVVKQHRLIQEILRQEIKGWHGVQLTTDVE